MTTNLKLTGLLVVLFAALSLAAQITTEAADTPILQRRCNTVALTTDTPLLPYRLIAPYFERRPDFQASKLVLVADPSSADAAVQLIASTGLDTRILVTNRLSGQWSSMSSDWTNYPGMIALDAIEQLKLVCPGSVIEVPKQRQVLQCSMPELVYRPVHTLAACSRTSWMENRELYDALRSDAAVKRLSINLRPACSSADAVLEVTHNLEATVEWYWKLKSPQGDTSSAGHVIAYASKDAGAKIVDGVSRELAIANGAVLNDYSHSQTQRPRSITPRILKVKLLPSDFAMRDTSLELFVDSEWVSARDTHGNLVFQFAVQDFRDARLAREWEQPLQMDFPMGLIAWTANAGDHWFDPVTIRGGEMPFNHGALFLSGALGTMSYVTIGAIAAQVRTPWHRLELAWDQDGVVNTVTLQVPSRGSKELVRDLQMSSAAARPACAVTNADIR
jgi:hypothetical protein